MAPKHKQLHFTTWNFHRGPKILHLLRLIFSIASCLAEGSPGADAQQHTAAHGVCQLTHNLPTATCIIQPGISVGCDLEIPCLYYRKMMINQYSGETENINNLFCDHVKKMTKELRNFTKPCETQLNGKYQIHHCGIQCGPIKGHRNAFFFFQMRRVPKI